MLEINHRALVSRADLVYRSPVETSLEGHPVGNGVMGTMVSTTPSAVRLQINRCDVFAVNKDHDGLQASPTDYCGGCAQVVVDVGGRPFEAGEDFVQQLALYEAECSIAGAAISVRCFVSALADVMVLEVDDRRADPLPLRVMVSMWRPPEVRTGDHVARFSFDDLDESVHLVQQFEQGDYYCSAAVAVTVVGDDVQVEAPTERTRVLAAAAQEGKRTILISSAASWSRQEAVGTTAVGLLEEAAGRTYDELCQEHANWWSDFWARTFVHLSSADGMAEFMERVRTLHMYSMASTSRGALPPKWNGSLFVTDGDQRHWGAQYWVWTTEMHYFPLLAADAIDLMETYFDMYREQLADCKKAAAQRWGAQGAFYPETTPFDGPTLLPDDVAAEYRDLYLGRKSNLQLSERARALGLYDSSLRVLAKSPVELDGGCYTWISHVVSSGSELAIQAWWRYRYTGDVEWLRSHAYPMLRETVEFYRHLVEEGEDGRYHLHGTNVHEDFWGASDGIMDLAAIRGTAPLALRAAEILEVDGELCAKWRDLLDRLAPYPMGSEPQAQALTGGVLADDVWAAGHRGAVDGQRNPEDVWLNPVFPFEDWTLETRDAAVDGIVQKIVDMAPRMQSILSGDDCNTAIRTPIAWIRAGRGEALPAIVGSYYHAFAPLANGWSLFEGANQAHSIEPLGCISTILQEGLLQSVAARPGDPEIISVFPAWPRQWEASFRLLARGGFMVTALVEHGEVVFVEIESRLGEPCRLRNPWGGPCAVGEVGDEALTLDGEILRFDTERGRRYRILSAAKSAPATRHIVPEAGEETASYTLTTPTGKTLRGTLGRGR